MRRDDAGSARGRAELIGTVERRREGIRAVKYTNSIEIRLPRDQVAQMLADPAHLPKWLRGMVVHEPISGAHGQLGTRSRVIMQSGKREFEATETITRRDPEDLGRICSGAAVHFEREIVAPGVWSAYAIS